MNRIRTGATGRQKLLALLAGGVVVAVGSTITLAVWNDAEWVTGGADTNGDGIPDAPGVGTSTFEVQQNVSSPYSDAAWTDRETAPGGALTFSPGSLALSPGEASYAPVSLRTTSASVAATSITLAGAVNAAGIPIADIDGLLFDSLALRVVATTAGAGTTPAACSAASFTAASDYVVGTETVPATLDAAGTLPTSLAAAGGNRQDYCFEITLPVGAPDTLQGRSAAPSWQFVADSAD